jgi:co-chaperonin GroES (HSP10)
MIQMVNGYVAVGNQTQFGGLMKGTVVLISPGITAVSIGDEVFYSLGDVQAVVYNGTEYIVIPGSLIMGKM